VSFFKKNKSKKRQDPKKRSPRAIKDDIAQMDEALSLDQQIEDLTAKLNISPEDELQSEGNPTQAPALSGAAPMSETAEKLAENTAMVSSLATSDPSLETDLPSFEEDKSELKTTRLSMADMRMGVAQISSDIQSGEELYRRALQRVEGLMGQVEKAEVDFSVLNRLEPENRRLKARLRTAQSELEGHKSKLNLITADLEDHQERLDEKTVQYEQARTKLISTTKALNEYDRVLKQTKSDVERHSLALERNKTALNVENRENKVLKEKISELSEAVEARQTEYLEASKIAEALKADCEDFRKQAETYRGEAQDMRITLNTAKRQNNAMKGEMLALHDDIKTFKTQYEFNVIDKEDRVAELEAQLASMAKELDVKKDASDSRDAEFANLRRIRAQQDIERERLEKTLDRVNAELADTKRLKVVETSEQITVLKRDISELQADLKRRDEISQQTQSETDALRRQLTSADLLREKLQTQLDIQARDLQASKQASPVSELEAQIETLTDQLRIKDEIVQSAAQDVTALREARDAQAAEHKRLEDLIHGQTYQLETAQKALLESKQNESELDQRYKDVAAALSVNNTRRKAENPASTPDIKPDIADDETNLDNVDIEKRILDYKFGIADKII